MMLYWKSQPWLQKTPLYGFLHLMNPSIKRLDFQFSSFKMSGIRNLHRKGLQSLPLPADLSMFQIRYDRFNPVLLADAETGENFVKDIVLNLLAGDFIESFQRFMQFKGCKFR